MPSLPSGYSSPPVEELEERITKLRSEKGAAERAEIEKQIAEEENAMLTDAISLDDGIGRVIIARDSVFARRDKLMKLSQEIGNDTRRFDRISEHMRNAVMTQVFPRDRFLTREWRSRYSLPFSMLLGKALNGESWQEDVGEIETDALKAS